jgi:hypothetical protein
VPKQPAFILRPPPTVPGIQDKNSNPLKLFSAAKSDNFLSKTAVPEMIMFEFNTDNRLKFFPSLIITPS